MTCGRKNGGVLNGGLMRSAVQNHLMESSIKRGSPDVAR
jgi:hypothetical protein